MQTEMLKIADNASPTIDATSINQSSNFFIVFPTIEYRESAAWLCHNPTLADAGF